MRLIREDVAQLIKSGHEQIAFNRVEQLIKDESIVAVYDLLDHFCEFILVNFSYIRRHKDCPNDINEAVSSLIFASARCGDLPELRVIRKLFGERYGQGFARTAVELSLGNLVNREIKEKLSPKSVTDDVKHRLVDEIARDYSLIPEILALEYYPEWKQEQEQVKESSGQQVPNTDVQTYNDTTKGSEMQVSTVEEMERNVIYVDSLSTSKKILTELCDSLSHQDSDISIAFTSSIVQQSSTSVVESPMNNKADKVEKSKLNSPYKYKISGLDHKEVRKAAASSSESLPQFPEETIVYLDDIEEFQSSSTNERDCQDQRLFKFKSTLLPKSETIEDSGDQSNMNHYESWSEKSGSRSSRKRRKASGKRLRRRSMSQDNQSVNDIECGLYNDNLCNNSPTHRHTKHQKQTRGVGRQQSNYAPKRLKKPCCLDSEINFQSCNCSYDPEGNFFNSETESSCLGNPIYFCTCDNKDSREVLPCKQKRGITTLVGFPTHGPEQELVCNKCCHHYWSWNEELDKEMEWTTSTQKPRRRRSHDSGSTVYNVFTYLDHQPNKQNKEMKGKADRSHSPCSCVSSKVSCQRVTSSFTRKETLSPYSRADTMPPERPKEDRTEAMLRSNSCPFQYPNHVHPKLPDYDDISAKFLALKKELVQNKGGGSNRQLL